MRNTCYQLLSAADTGSQTSAKIDANQLISASFQAVFGDATAIGTLKVQGSNDPTSVGNVASTFTPTNWIDVNCSCEVYLGVAQELIIAQTCYRWLRVVYTRTSGGSTTVVVNVNALSVA